MLKFFNYLKLNYYFINYYYNILVALAKKCVNESYNSTLDQGLAYEKTSFYATFGFNDRNEGMNAFTEKRKPKFEDN